MHSCIVPVNYLFPGFNWTYCQCIHSVVHRAAVEQNNRLIVSDYLLKGRLATDQVVSEISEISLC
jgi:hypothetical protein